MPTTYYRRRDLTLEEHLPAMGAAAGAALAVGCVVFYFTRLMLQRTPLVDLTIPPPAPPAGAGTPPVRAGRARSLVR